MNLFSVTVSFEMDLGEISNYLTSEQPVNIRIRQYLQYVVNSRRQSMFRVARCEGKIQE